MHSPAKTHHNSTVNSIVQYLRIATRHQQRILAMVMRYTPCDSPSPSVTPQSHDSNRTNQVEEVVYAPNPNN